MIGNRIGALMRDQGLSNKETAKRAQIDPSHLSKITGGKIQNPSWEIIKRLAEVLGVDPLYIATGKRHGKLKKLDRDVQRIVDAAEKMNHAQRTRYAKMMELETKTKKERAKAH